METRTITFKKHSDPLVDGLLVALQADILDLETLTMRGGRYTFDSLRAVAEAKMATESATSETNIHHKHENIAASVPQPKEDLLQDEPQGPTPYAKVLGELLADPRTKDITAKAISPFLERKLAIVGSPAKVLKAFANEFCDLPVSKMIFATDHILKGKHTQFPRIDEFYVGIGRYKPSPRPSASDPNVHVNGAHA